MASSLQTSAGFRPLSSGGRHRDNAEGQRGPEDASDRTQERKSAIEPPFNEAQRHHRYKRASVLIY